MLPHLTVEASLVVLTRDWDSQMCIRQFCGRLLEDAMARCPPHSVGPWVCPLAELDPRPLWALLSDIWNNRKFEPLTFVSGCHVYLLKGFCEYVLCIFAIMFIEHESRSIV